MGTTESTSGSAHDGRMGAWAPYYDLLMKVLTVGREGALRRTTLELAGIAPGDRVLEVGYRVLKPSGRLFIAEMGKPDFPGLRRSMTEAGFTDIENGERKLFPVPWPLLYLRAVARKDLGSGQRNGQHCLSRALGRHRTCRPALPGEGLSAARGLTDHGSAPLLGLHVIKASRATPAGASPIWLPSLRAAAARALVRMSHTERAECL